MLGQTRANRLLWIWARWGGDEEVRAWLENQMKSERSLLRLAELIPSVGYSSGKPGDGKFMFVDESYDKLLPLSEFEAKLRALDIRANAAEAKEVISRYFSAEREKARDGN